MSSKISKLNVPNLIQFAFDVVESSALSSRVLDCRHVASFSNQSALKSKNEIIFRTLSSTVNNRGGMGEMSE